MTADVTLRPAVPLQATDDHTPVGPQWVPTRALGRAVLVTGLLLILGVALGRVDVVLLAAPFAIGTAVGLRRRPAGAPGLVVNADDTQVVVEGGEVAGEVVAANPDLVAYDLVVVRSRVSPWLRVPVADRPHALRAPAGEQGHLELSGQALRWGRHALGPAAVRAAACGGLLASRPVVTGERLLRVYPSTDPFQADEAMPRAAGLVGGHRSRRPGEGGELAGVRVFAPGDRLRRVDWRVSLRARQLHVAATLSDRDAEVVLLLDVLAEAGRSGGIRGSASVLDTTVRATAAIAEHYLHRGDRVSLLEYGPAGRRLRPATGRRQYLTVLEWLLDVEAGQAELVPYDHAVGAQLISPNALVVVLTPLVDPRSGDMVGRLARSGRFVVAVDTLPDAVAPTPTGASTELAYRLWRLERDNTLGQLREHGVPIVAWAGAGSLDLVLRDVARMAAAPKAVGR